MRDQFYEAFYNYGLLYNLMLGNQELFLKGQAVLHLNMEQLMWSLMQWLPFVCRMG